MTGQSISQKEFATLFREFRTAFRLEWQQSPVAGERDAYQRFLAGSPMLPPEWPEWQGWLDRVQEMTRKQHKLIRRVLIVDDQPSPYQRWRQWGAPWHVSAGEGIWFLARREADRHGIPAGNWWLFNDELVVIMALAPDGDVSGYTLVSAAVGSYRAWRDLALHHAAAAETIPV